MLLFLLLDPSLLPRSMKRERRHIIQAAVWPFLIVIFPPRFDHNRCFSKGVEPLPEGTPLESGCESSRHTRFAGDSPVQYKVFPRPGDSTIP